LNGDVRQFASVTCLSGGGGKPVIKSFAIMLVSIPVRLVHASRLQRYNRKWCP
jgi:hypothetical protein